MKTTLTIAMLALAVLAGKNQAGAQGTAFTYQGRVTDNGTNFTGIGQFKFALINSGMTYWSNDGTSIGDSQPASAVGVGVTNGLFMVTLGNTALANMTVIPADLFTSQPNLQLQIWFSDGIQGFSALSPAQNLTPTPYAVFAESAGSLQGTIPLSQLPAGGLDLVTNNETGVVLGELSLTGSTLLGGNLYLPFTQATIFAGISPLIYYNGNNNFFAGVNAGLDIGSGANNTGVGSSALRSITSGSDNSAFGEDALTSNNSGSNNVAMGFGTLAFNQTGYGNTAVGFSALALSGSGVNNTAIGENALVSTSGGGNTAVGGNALNSNGSSYNNTAIGYQALSTAIPGVDNVALGVNSLYADTGSQNTAIGTYALQGFTSGGGNIALGCSAGQSLTSGDNNIYIGSPGSSTESGIIRIGTPGTHTATYLAGTAYCQILGITSDRNAKENFAAIHPRDVLAKVATLPVTEWNYKTDRQDQQHIGPMAQDFRAAFGLNGADDKHISMADECGVALAAIQGLNEQLQDKDVQIQALSQTVSELRKMVEQMEPQAASRKQH
jgi:hypothetical protein